MSTLFQPLYRQVYDLLKQRLKDGVWKPADLIPSEFALADELGVSQGTVRKALNQMVDENFLYRKQGKGTFVSEHTQESSLFRFFRLRRSGGQSLIPQTELLSSQRRTATRRECEKLDLKQAEEVVELIRRRSIEGELAVLEFVIQPLSIFPDIDQIEVLPNSLYTLYQEKYGITITRVQDELRAVALPADLSQYLELPANSPVMLVERASINIDERVVEWSQAYCTSGDFVYAASHK